MTQEGCDPATLDREILTGLLREELGYRGVVVTDALNMAGVREKYGDERIPVLALKTGVDMPMMVSTDTDTVSLEVAYNAVLNAVHSGELTEDRIDESVYRVLKLKRSRGLFLNPYVGEQRAASKLGTPRHLAAAGRVSKHNVTLVRNDAGLLPLDAGGGQKVLVTGYRSVSNTANAQPAAHLAAALDGQGVTTESSRRAPRRMPPASRPLWAGWRRTMWLWWPPPTRRARRRSETWSTHCWRPESRSCW